MAHTVALVTDLMDRSRISAARPDVRFVRTPAECADADVVLVDLAVFGDTIESLRSAAPTSRIVAFGPHVDRELAARAARAGADTVLARSELFRDVAAAIAVTHGGPAGS